VPSIEPGARGSELNGGEEVEGGLIVECGGGTELLRAWQTKFLDKMTSLAEISVMVTADLPVGRWWDRRCLGGGGHDPMIGIETW
jgi:hypothetical protein